MMNLRPMEVRDNSAVAQLIRASLEEFGLDKPGTVYFDSHLDYLADYYQQQERAAYFVLEDEGQLVGCGGFAPVSDKIAELQKLYVTKNSRGKGYSSRLIKRIFQKARLAGYEQLYLETSLLNWLRPCPSISTVVLQHCKNHSLTPPATQL